MVDNPFNRLSGPSVVEEGGGGEARLWRPSSSYAAVVDAETYHSNHNAMR